MTIALLQSDYEVVIHSLLYVSTSQLGRSEANGQLADIVAVSRTRNDKLGITGCLVLARDHFAQVLAGERVSLNMLMDSIRQDRRHSGVSIVSVSEVEKRQFDGWSMAYVGNSTYVDRHIIPLLPALQEAQSRGEAVQQLLSLMSELTAPNEPDANASEVA